jgi:deazaflavin-dependent oxidoreductase (nitroreductase family)
MPELLNPAGLAGVEQCVTSEKKARNEYTDEDWHEWNRKIVDEFRRNRGAVGGTLAGAPLLLLTTVGRRTGLPRMTPLTYLPDGHRMIVFASRGGSTRTPFWYINLRSYPSAIAELPDETVEVEATVLAGKEREQLWTRQKQLYPVFSQYEQVAGREIPVVALSRAT